MSTLANDVKTLLLEKLGIYRATHDIGRLAAEGKFKLNLKRIVKRIPDVAFVSYERRPKDDRIDPLQDAAPLTPDLIVEVASPTDTLYELRLKVQEYLRAGARLVWVVDPIRAEVYVYPAGEKPRVLQRDQILDAEPVLPGFRLPLAELLPEPYEIDSPDDA